jgi:GntR family transcriptional regulator / MocR family aminotransferase
MYHSTMAQLSGIRTLTLPPRERGELATKWLYGALRGAILEGRLKVGSRLPSTRAVARMYQVARGTVVAAFEQLKAEGYLETSLGSGTFVARALPEDFPKAARKSVRSSGTPLAPVRRTSAYARRVRPYDEAPNTGRARAFRVGQPAVELFPIALWARVAARRVRGATRTLLEGCGASGYQPLREAVAEYLSAARGVVCVADQVVMVSGVQEALDLVARLLLDPGDRVVIEDPGYFGARNIFEAAGATVVPLAVDDEGLTVDREILSDARLVYVTPAHQFPLGMTMSLPRRLALLEHAASKRTLIFEDDYDSEYRYGERPLPALQGLDRHGLVLLAGSFNKLLFPALRLGYLVVPLDLVDGVAALKSMTSRHLPSLEQAVLADFMAEGHFARHLRRMRDVYAERLEALSASAGEHLGGLLEIAGIEAGIQTVGWLRAGINADAAARAASERGVEVTPLNKYWSSRPPAQGLCLGFAAVDRAAIRKGVLELEAALRELSRARRKGAR